MSNFNKVLIAAVASLLASQSEAKIIYNTCLVRSEELAGQETGVAFSNEAELAGSMAVTDEMRLHSFTACANSEGFLTGLQFFLSLNPYSEDSGKRVELGAIGNMDGECQTLRLQGGFDRIRASSSIDSTGQLKDVDNIRFYRGNLAKTYGEIGDDYTQWLFAEERPLVGLYGRQSEGGIDQLGFITLDPACQAEVAEAVESDEELVAEPTDLEEMLTDKEFFEEKTGLPLGWDLLTLGIACAGILIFILVLTLSICACKAKAKKNRENRIEMMTAPPVKTPEGPKKRVKQQKVARELKPVDAGNEVYSNARVFSDGKKTKVVRDGSKVASLSGRQTPAEMEGVTNLDEEAGI